MLNLNFQNGTTPALNARNMNAIVESINTLGYAVGGPNVASTVSEMTDTSKVYVYTGSETGYTAGNWYYYNGSAWVSGGVYQATAVETDTTLTMPGEPADAKATGDAVTELKSATKNILYRSVSSLAVELFEKGGLLNGEETDFGGNARIRTPVLMALNDLQIFADTETYERARIGIQTLAADGTFIRDSGWLKECTIKTGSVFRAVLARDIYDTTNEYSVSEVFSCFNLPTILDVSSDVIYLTSIDQIMPLFEHGSMDMGVDIDYYANSRARTVGVISCRQDIFIKYNSGSFGVHYFENGVCTKATPWLTTGRFIPKGTHFRVIVTPDPTKWDYKDLSEILSCIDFRLADVYEYGLNPNVLYQARNVDDTEYPPYSKWYIQASAINQYDRVRVNIRKTTDGHYVLIHDSTINSEARNLDGTTISETISSNGQSLATLNSYDWGIKYGSKYAGFGVPTLEEACLYAAMYNLGLTIEVSFWATNEEIDEIAEIINRYGLLQNLVVIAIDSHVWGFSHWVSINDYISVQVAGDIEYLTEHEAEINSYKTDKNTVYVGALPWPSVASDAIRELAFKNSWKLYCGMIMNRNDLFNVVGFDKGYSIIEANNLYRIKDTVRDYADETLT